MSNLRDAAESNTKVEGEQDGHEDLPVLPDDRVLIPQSCDDRLRAPKLQSDTIELL